METLVQLFQSVPKPDKYLRYGTAGFRDEHTLLHRCVVAAGAVAALRSRHTGKCTGVMITASHNPAQDNGVKIVDTDGGMLAPSWEPFAEALANSDDILAVVRDACAKEGICDDDIADSVVFTGVDTRSHSPGLQDLVERAVAAIGGRTVSLGQVTTPMLHFVVQQMNNYASPFMVTSSPDAEVQNYFWTIAEGYNLMLKGVDNIRPWKVYCDCAHGVGGLHVRKLFDDINAMARRNVLSISTLNLVSEGEVNDGCGAEWVQKGQIPPRGIVVGSDEHVGQLLCSMDGDADRIVFHTIQKDDAGNNQWILLDGDRILTLFATFIHKLLQEAGLTSEISLGIVQTAYANGASTAFLRNQGMHVELAKTGVKYLHHKAQNYDIGIYFEANGHGTAMFMPSFYNKIELLAPHSPEVQRLLACGKCINQAVGDAMSDLVFVLAALQYMQWDISDWVNMYSDLPSKQVKVPVVDRTAIVCSEDETQALAPEGMQDALSEAMQAVEDGRCFVRPSGTEDVARVYAEAQTAERAAELADRCVAILDKFIGVRA